MDETSLGAALRRATDDVEVPRDLVRGAERLGRERRTRRRRNLVAVSVAAVVLVGGVVVALEPGTGRGSSASSAADGRESAGSASPPAAGPDSLADQAPSAAASGEGCAPALAVDGAPRGGDGPPVVVRAGDTLELAGGPLPCSAALPGAVWSLTLVPDGGAAPPEVLGSVVPARDGSFSTEVTVPAAAPPGPARVSITGTTADGRPCADDAGCPPQGYGADLEVLGARG